MKKVLIYGSVAIVSLLVSIALAVAFDKYKIDEYQVSDSDRAFFARKREECNNKPSASMYKALLQQVYGQDPNNLSADAKDHIDRAIQAQKAECQEKEVYALAGWPFASTRIFVDGRRELQITDVLGFMCYKNCRHLNVPQFSLNIIMIFSLVAPSASLLVFFVTRWRQKS